MGASNRVEGRGGFDFETAKGSAVVDALGEAEVVLYAGGDHKEEPGREEGAKKGARKVGVGVGVLSAKLFKEEEREMELKAATGRLRSGSV